MSTPQLDDQELAFLQIINDYRHENGMGPLQVSIKLTNAARWMSQDMANKNYFSHTDSLGRNPFTRINAFGYTYNAWKGENLAAGNASAAATFCQLRDACDPDSTGKCTYAHRQNMLNPNFKVIGINRYNNNNSTYRWYWTTDFGGYVDDLIPTSPSTTKHYNNTNELCQANSTFNSNQSSTYAESQSTSMSINWLWFIIIIVIILFIIYFLYKRKDI